MIHLRGESGYWSPYVAGAAIGLTLVASYYVMGHGLGASGAFTHATAHLVEEVAPEHATANSYLQQYLRGGSLWSSWIFLEVVGVSLGGLIGAITARRFRFGMEGCAVVGKRKRALLAILGGCVVGFGSRLALGCTSGQALSGGAVLAVGSWLFTLMFFLGAFAVAWLFRREWQ
jgi:uncharacterized protein